jgi:hypothetical protein
MFMFNKPYALSDRTTRTITTVNDVDMIEFSGLSLGGRPFSITTNLNDAQRWVNGELIQVAFPYLNADDREILKTGIDAQEWETMFAGTQEEDDE